MCQTTLRSDQHAACKCKQNTQNLTRLKVNKNEKKKKRQRKREKKRGGGGEGHVWLIYDREIVYSIKKENTSLINDGSSGRL